MQVRNTEGMRCDTNSNTPRGELYIKGNSVMSGYFKDPESTKNVLVDGWLKVGDLVEVLPNGAIKVIERVQEFTKLQNGQYIAPQQLESIYLKAPMIKQLCIEVNPKFNHLVAIVTLDEEKVAQLAQINSQDGVEKGYVQPADIEFTVLKQFQNLANQSGLDDIQRVKRVHILNEQFSYKNGLLTNTQKMKRFEVLKRYRKEVDQLLEMPKLT